MVQLETSFFKTLKRLLMRWKLISISLSQTFYFISKKNISIVFLILKLLVTVPIFMAMAIFLPPIVQTTVSPVLKFHNAIFLSEISDQQRATETEQLKKNITLLINKFAHFTPRSNYLIVNSAENKFFIYRGKNMIYHGMCSTGSFILLKNGAEQQWLFKTPRGEFQIKSKTRFPVWKKPDWAFIEEGLPVPPANHSSRYEYGVLGEYALSLGDGYLIHGTLYQRFMGLPVTHGCIRLNDKDLEFVYNSLSTGSKVYIY